MAIYLTSLLSLLLAALSVAPSVAHVLEAWPRLFVWSPELWREATVFNGQFALFAWLGGPIDIAAIGAAVVLAYLLRLDRRSFWPALIGAAMLTAGLIAWAVIVAPMNWVLATWTRGPIATDFDAVRLQWEVGHMVVAMAKITRFLAIGIAVAAPRLPVPRAAAPSGRVSADAWNDAV
jgi:hypothetical protein